jgi:alcohol dehydrogenase class IV
MINNYRFFLHTELFFGTHIHKDLGNFISKLYPKVLFIIDENISHHSALSFLKNSLKSLNIEVSTLLLRGTEEPDYDYLDEIAIQAKKIPADLIIAVGGGSTLDLAKAVSVLMTNSGCGLDYRGFDQVKIPGIPLMAIPSTAGTASEVTINAVFTNKSENKKLGINGNHLNPKYAVLDPHFISSAPKKVMVSSGTDAMVHALESFVGTNAPETNFTFAQRQNANPVTKVFAKEAFKLLHNNLRYVLNEDPDLENLLNIQLGSYFAGISLFNSSSGIAGGLSYPLGVHYKIPHGICGGMFATSIIKYNIENGYYGYADLYDYTFEQKKDLSPLEKSEIVLRSLEQLFEYLNVPKSLSEFGVTKKDYDHIVEITQGLQGAFDQNPIPLDVKNVGKIIDSFF